MYIKRITILAMTALISFGCDYEMDNDLNKSGSEITHGKMTLHLGNSENVSGDFLSKPKLPPMYEQVNVNILRVEFLLSGFGKGTRVVTNENFGQFDLMSLQSGHPLPITEMNLPNGVSLHQIRIVLEENGNHVVIDDEVHDLQTPSATKSGLKVIFKQPITVEDGNTYSFLVDFSVDKNIVAKGNGGFLLKPVLKVRNALVIPNDTDDDILDEEDEFDDVADHDGVEDIADEIDNSDGTVAEEDMYTDEDMEDFFGEVFDITDPDTWPEGITLEDIDAFFGDGGL